MTLLRSLVAPALAIATTGTTLALAPLRALARPVEPRRLGYCVGCGGAVTSADAFLRYRGDYYHAHKCLEANPPALRESTSRR